MAIPTDPQHLTNIIAYNGDKVEIPNDTQPDSGQPSIASGWPRITSLPITAGGVAPSREGFNGLFNLLSQHTFFQQSGGLYSWSNSLSYPVGSVIRASNGGVYLATANNGVDYSGVGAKDPISSPTFWSPLLINGVAPLSAGGTGAATAPQARSNLGLGTAATQNVGTDAGQVPTYGAGQVLDGNVRGTAKTITDVLGVEKGGTGNTGGQAISIGIGVDKHWQTDGSFNIFKYEQANLTVYKLPTPNCFVFKFSPYGSVGVAYAIKWAHGVKMWISALHETWGEWVEVFDKKMVVPSANGGTGHTSVAPFSPSIASHSISYILTTPLYAPAGGAWFYSFFTMTSGNPADNYAGVVEGGAMIHPAASGYKALGFMWKIA